jgi:RimJ/RimL family protein N-acetyltransferase
VTELRPIRVDDLDVLTRWKTDPDYGSEFQWLGFGSTRRFREQVANDDVIGDDGGALAIADGDELLGDMSWRKLPTNALRESFCWDFGIVLRPEARGKGHGSRAQRLLADYLFLHTTANRVEASTDIDNIAEQRSLDKAGFTREGVLRGYQWRQGAWRDMVLFSRLRGDA